MSDPWPAPRFPTPVDLDVALPGSKSITNRALLLAAIADGPSVLERPLVSRDTDLMIAALRGLGTQIEVEDDRCAVSPTSQLRGPAVIDCGLAGTVMRFLPPVASLASGPISFDGDPHMRSRPVGEVLAALRALGAAIDGAGLPFTVQGSGGLRGGQVVLDASGSSQFVSALLLAGARYELGLEIRHVGKPMPSLPHVEMTVAMLREHGVEVDDVDADRWRVAPGPIEPVDRRIEPDLSNAAPVLALAAVTGGRVRIRDWPATTTQAGDELRAILSQMGCHVRLDDNGLELTGPERLRGIDVDLHDVGELTPAVAALCALAESPSHLRGVAHIRHHETDRLAALRRELGALGADVEERADGLSFRPAELHGGVFHTYADHRMAHAGVVIGAAVDGVLVENVNTTAKTFPGFAAFWSGLGLAG